MLAAMATVVTTAAACSGNDPQPVTVPTFSASGAGDVTALTDDTSNPLAFPAYSDPDTPIYIGVGKRFAVMLEANPSTGYRWEAVRPPDPKVVTPLGTQFLTASTAVPGAPESEILNYVATGVGVTEIALRYSPAAGAAGADARTATFHVTVTLDGQPPPTTTLPDPSTASTTFGRSSTTTTTRTR